MNFFGVIMKSLLLGLVLAMSAALPAAAENWVHVDESSATTLYVDGDSITPINGGYTYREMVVSKEDNKVLVAQSQMLCRERQIRPVAYNLYNRNGKLIKSRETLNVPFESIMLETVKATLWEKLCN